MTFIVLSSIHKRTRGHTKCVPLRRSLTTTSRKSGLLPATDLLSPVQSAPLFLSIAFSAPGVCIQAKICFSPYTNNLLHTLTEATTSRPVATTPYTRRLPSVASKPTFLTPPPCKYRFSCSCPSFIFSSSLLFTPWLVAVVQLFHIFVLSSSELSLSPFAASKDGGKISLVTS
jgi:hypothetical protein